MSFEHSLRDRFSNASKALPGRPLEWSDTYSRVRRQRTIYVRAMALGTAILLTVGGFAAWTLLDGGGNGSVPVPPARTDAPQPRRSATPSPDPSNEPTPKQDVSFEAPFTAVEAFIEAAGAGDAEAMWDEMSDLSKAVYDHDLERFREAVSPIAEGWGSWSAAEDLRMHWETIGSSDEGTAGVVTLTGVRAPEGNLEPYASAGVPVRVDREGTAKVELFVTRGVFEYMIPRDLPMEQPPSLDSLVTRQPTFEVLVPSTAIDVHMVVAPVPDEPTFSASGLATLKDADKERVHAVWSPNERLFPDEWFLTVVAVYNDGIQAQSVRFTIE